jgi:hypothetical protein
MDKPSEQRKEAKECGDTDIGIHDYGAGGKRAQLAGLWTPAPSEVVGGTVPGRLGANCYHKDEILKEHGVKKPGLLGTLIDEHDTRGPPFLNTSKPARVF